MAPSPGATISSRPLLSYVIMDVDSRISRLIDQMRKIGFVTIRWRDVSPGNVPRTLARLALERFHQALSWFESPVMTLEPPGEGLMRLSRSNKLVLFGIALLMVGLAGRAAADETPSSHPQAKPAASAPSPAKKKPAKSRESARQKAVTVSARQGSGPGGSRMVTGSRAVALTFDDGPDPAETP